MIKKIQSKLVHGKMYIQRAMTYATIANSCLLLFLFMSRLEDYGIDLRLDRWYWYIIIGTPFVLILIGYIDDKLGFFRMEQKAIARRNQYFVEIDEKLDSVIEELRKLKEETEDVKKIN